MMRQGASVDSSLNISTVKKPGNPWRVSCPNFSKSGYFNCNSSSYIELVRLKLVAINYRCRRRPSKPRSVVANINHFFHATKVMLNLGFEVNSVSWSPEYVQRWFSAMRTETTGPCYFRNVPWICCWCQWVLVLPHRFKVYTFSCLLFNRTKYDFDSVIIICQ